MLLFDKNCHIRILTKKETFSSRNTNFFTLPIISKIKAESRETIPPQSTLTNAENESEGVERQIVANPNIKLNLSFFTLFPQIIPAFSSIPSDYS